MTRCLYILFLLACGCIYGANPSFSNFDTSQFGTANNRVVIKSGASVTNLAGEGTLTLGNNGTIVYKFGTNGGVFIGNSSAGPVVSAFPQIFMTTETVSGGPNSSQIFLQAVIDESTYNNVGFVDIFSDTNHSYIAISVNNSTQITMDAIGDTGSATFSMQSGGVPGVELSPNTANGSTAFQFNTTKNQTSGDLFTLSNSNAPAFNVTFNGAIKGGTPNGGTAAAWKPGIVHTGVVGLVLITTNYVELDIGGVLKKVALVQ